MFILNLRVFDVIDESGKLKYEFQLSIGPVE